MSDQIRLSSSPSNSSGSENFSINSSSAIHKSVIRTLVVFLYLFNLELEGMGGIALSSLILILAIWLPLGSKRDILQPYLSNAVFILLLFLPPLAWAAAYTYFYGSDAIVLPWSALKTYGWSCCVALILYDFYDQNYTPKQFLVSALSSLVFSLLLQSIFILISFFVVEFAELVNNILIAKGNLTGLEEHRSKGLANSGGANMSMLLSFGVMAAISVFHLIRQKRYFIFALFITFASALVGRSGFFAGAGFIALYSLLFEPKIRLGLYSFIILGVFLTATEFKGISLLEADNAWGNWFFLEAENSVSDLISMVSDMPDMASLIIGAGFFEDAVGSYSRTDSGFMKAINVFGVPLALYFYGVVVYILLCGGKPFSRHNNLPHTYFYYFVTVMFVVVMVSFEFKESMAYQNMTGRALFLFANLAMLFHLKQTRRHALP